MPKAERQTRGAPRRERPVSSPARSIEIPDYLWLKIRRRALLERTDVHTLVAESIAMRLGLVDRLPSKQRRAHRRPGMSSERPQGSAGDQPADRRKRDVTSGAPR